MNDAKVKILIQNLSKKRNVKIEKRVNDSKVEEISQKSLEMSLRITENLHKRVWIQEYLRLRNLQLELQLDLKPAGIQNLEITDPSQTDILETEIKNLENSFLENKFLQESDFSFLEIYRILKEFKKENVLEFLEGFEVSANLKGILEEYFKEISEILKEIGKENVLKRDFRRKEILKFKKLQVEYQNYTKDNFYSRLKKEFPSLQKKEFMELEFYLQKIKIYNHKIYTTKIQFLDKIKEFITHKFKAFIQNQNAEQVFLEKEKEIQKRENIKKKNAKVLTRFHEKLQVQKEIQIRSRKSFDEEIQAKECMENSKKCKEKLQKIDKLDKFYEKLQLIKNQTLEIKQEREKEEFVKEEIQKSLQRKNLEKRKEIILIKDLELLKKKELEKQKIRNSQRRLEALKIPVIVERYFFALLTISDPERIFKETASFSSSKQAKEEKPLFPVHSFTLEKLMQDKRLVLSMALHAQGLQHSSYGREILSSLGHKQTRDFKSNVSF
jgi:hypothetical protein